MEIEERFWSKVDWTLTEDRCWPWLAATNSRGYGRFGMGKYRNVPAHCVAYELEVGGVPPGHMVDHVKARGCTTTLCCNPDHLEAVTVRENTLRGNAPSAVNARKVSCPKCAGPYQLTSRGKRICRPCTTKRELTRRRRAAGLG